METKEKVLQVLKETGSPMKAGEIAEKAGIEKKEAEKAIKALLSEEKLLSPKRCYYDLNE
jgi:predicted ArsR family transcriptional regulator